MLEYNRYVQKKISMLVRIVTLVLVLAIGVILLAQTAFAKSTYLINDGDRVLVHSTYATNPADILVEAGLRLGAEDTFTTKKDQGVSEITVQRKQTITVHRGNYTAELISYGESVEELLCRNGIVLDMADTLSVSRNAATYDGMVITICRRTSTQETYTATLPHGTEYCYDATLPAGTQIVLTQGVDGQLLCSATVHYINGTEHSRVINSQVVIRQPVSEVIAIGTCVQLSAQPLSAFVPE